MQMIFNVVIAVMLAAVLYLLVEQRQEAQAAAAKKQDYVLSYGGEFNREVLWDDICELKRYFQLNYGGNAAKRPPEKMPFELWLYDTLSEMEISVERLYRIAVKDLDALERADVGIPDARSAVLFEQDCERLDHRLYPDIGK